MSERQPVRMMVQEANLALGGASTYTAIRDFIKEKYGPVNEGTITAQIILCSVNHPARINYTPNQKPRLCNSPQYDFLFNTGRGKVEVYRPDVHGQWEIRREENGKLVVAQLFEEGTVEEPEESDTLGFPLESHLRDFIASNLDSIKLHGAALHLYEDSSGEDGVEYPTDVGPIDILAQDSSGAFVIFELKLSKGPDRAVGQVLRYMGWVKKHLAGSKSVLGVIVAREIGEKLKYAVSLVPNISLLEYKLRFDLREVGLV